MKSLEELLKLSRDMDTDVRQAAATALGSCPEVDALDRLLELSQDLAADVRQAASAALGFRSEPIAQLMSRLENSPIEVLTHLLADHNEWFYANLGWVAKRRLALRGSVEERRYINPRSRLYASPGLFDRHKTSVATALGSRPEAAALDRLFALSQDWKVDENVRQAATTALASRSEPVAQLMSHLDHSPLEVITQLLSDHNDWFYANLGFFVGQVIYGNQKLFDRHNASVATALGPRPEEVALNFLLYLSEYEDENVRLAAIAALSLRSEPEALNRLSEFVSQDLDADENVRHAAITALSLRSEPEALNRLSEFVSQDLDADEEARRVANFVLSLHSEPEALKRLLECVFPDLDADEEVR